MPMYGALAKPMSCQAELSMSAEEPGKSEMGYQGLGFAATLSDCILSGVITVNGANKIESITQAAARMLRLEPDRVAKQSLDVLPPALRDIIGEISSSRIPITNRSIQLPGVGTAATSLRVSAFVMHGSRDPSVALVLNELDCGPFLDQHLRQLDRLASAGTLASSMAHEIRNALVAGKTFIDLLLEKNQDAELVEIVGREFGRIESIVSQMLKFAAPAKPCFSMIRLHDALDHSLRLVQSRIQSGSISLRRDYGAGPDLISGDDYQLEQAFVNLLLNAVEAMEPNGQLSVTTRSSPAPSPNHPLNGAHHGHLLLTIKDTGSGITAENMQHLFEPFFTTKPNGTGLGLLITRRIIQEHNGDITVESQPNQGAAFQIKLPTFTAPET